MRLKMRHVCGRRGYDEIKESINQSGRIFHVCSLDKIVGMIHVREKVVGEKFFDRRQMMAS
jgi:hypothetical protein